MMCGSCHQPKPTTGAIIDNKFGQFCRDCRNKMNRQANAGSAQYSRDRDRETHQRDLLNPWLSNGEPNREFIREYKEQAELTFTKEELEQYG